MNINKTNYGAWFIDYFDGTLSAEKTAELFLFLELHPGIKTEFESFNPIILDPGEAVFSGKEQLKKDCITPDSIEHYFIAEIEGDLNLQDKIKLREFLKSNPEYVQSRKIFGLTKLHPSKEIYPDKNSLKKKTILFPAINVRLLTAVAAAIILVLGLLYINRPEDKNETAGVNHYKRSNINDSLQDFFKNSGDIPAHVYQEKVADINNKKSVDKPSHKAINNEVVPEKTVAQQQKKKLHFATPDQSPVSNRKEEDMQLAVIRNAEPLMVSYDTSPLISSTVKYTGTAENSFAKNNNIKEKINEIKDLAAEKINAATGEEILYSQETLENPLADKVPVKSRILKLVAWAVGKISNEKIKMETTLDQSGNIAAYQVSAGKLKYIKDF